MGGKPMSSLEHDSGAPCPQTGIKGPPGEVANMVMSSTPPGPTFNVAAMLICTLQGLMCFSVLTQNLPTHSFTITLLISQPLQSCNNRILKTED